MTVKMKITWQSLVPKCGKSEDVSSIIQNKVIPKQTSVSRISISDLSSSSVLPEELSNSLVGSNLYVFTLAELKVITHGFSSSNFLGQGGFGPVHKGFIDDELRPGLKAQPVAVKNLDLDGMQGHKEWLTEVIFLGQLRHEHMVKLIGYCCEDENRLLVYEYMPRGSLENQLFRKYSVSIPWSTRMKIALGAAEGLAFLHEAEKPVIYRDFKASNILLDSFCANKLPYELPVGASPFHPQHSLSLCGMRKFYSFVKCGICRYQTNGFFYECETCDIPFDIRCVFLPARIRHKSHKHHYLVQSPPSISNTVTVCSVSKFRITDRLQLKYACETCPNFQIYILCAFYPSRMKHRYDDHSLILRQPPFFYQGVFYCQLCEEQVNNQVWLYHCDECDQSFHNTCLRSYESVKFGGTVKHSIDNQPHTLALVLKKTPRKSSPPYLCGICGKGHKFQFFFECGGCGYLACILCIRRIHGQ